MNFIIYFDSFLISTNKLQLYLNKKSVLSLQIFDLYLFSYTYNFFKNWAIFLKIYIILLYNIYQLLLVGFTE
jgi:hypothetical protein